MFEKLKDIIAFQAACSPKDVTLNAHLIDDLEMDSLDVIDIVMSIEDEFGCSITDEELENVRTVNDLYAALQNNIGK